MTTKVLSIRLDVRTIAQAMRILEDKSRTLPVQSSAIRFIAEATILQLEKSGKLPPITDSEALAYIELHSPKNVGTMMDDGEFSLEDAFSEVLGREIPGSPMRLPTPDQEEDELHELETTSLFNEGAKLAQALHQSRTPKITKPLEISTDEELETPPETVGHFWEVDHLPMAEIKVKAPKDSVVERFEAEANERDPNHPGVKTMRRAIEIVYKQLPQAEWGTERAHRLIQTLFEDNF